MDLAPTGFTDGVQNINEKLKQDSREEKRSREARFIRPPKKVEPMDRGSNSKFKLEIVVKWSTEIQAHAIIPAKPS